MGFHSTLYAESPIGITRARFFFPDGAKNENLAKEMSVLKTSRWCTIHLSNVFQYQQKGTSPNQTSTDTPAYLQRNYIQKLNRKVLKVLKLQLTAS